MFARRTVTALLSIFTPKLQAQRGVELQGDRAPWSQGNTGSQVGGGQIKVDGVKLIRTCQTVRWKADGSAGEISCAIKTEIYSYLQLVQLVWCIHQHGGRGNGRSLLIWTREPQFCPLVCIAPSAVGRDNPATQQLCTSGLVVLHYLILALLTRLCTRLSVLADD